MKIIIIEDEPTAAKYLERLLKQLNPIIEVLAVLESIEESIDWLEKNPPPMLIFSDIQLADGLSFEIFRKITIKTPVIFITAYDEYALQAFQTSGIAYLLKPVILEKLKQSLEKFEQLTQSSGDFSGQMEQLLAQISQPKGYKERFLVKIGDKFFTVPVNVIAYFYTEDRSTILFTQNKEKFIVDYPLEELEKMLSPQLFFRLNRQFIAHIQAIKEVHQYFNGKLKVILSPTFAQEVLISRERSGLFKGWLNQ